MKILIVSGSYFPAKSPRSFRTTELARELAKQGHSVTVLIPPSNLDTNQEKLNHHVDVTFLKAKRKKSLRVDNSMLGRVASRVNRLMEWLFEYPAIETVDLISEALTTLKYNRFDLLISIAYPHMNHWGCNRFLKSHPNFCKCWIADCGDPYMGATMQKVRPPFWFANIEKAWCRRADFITVPIEGAKDGYYPEFRDKIVVIPQGFNMDNIVLSEYQPNDIPTFAYSGGVGLGQRNPLIVLDRLEQMNVQYHAIFYTNQRNFFSKYADNPRVELRDYIAREQLLTELSKVDFLLNLDNGTTRQLPSKLIDYAITGRPILNINVSDLNQQLLTEFILGNYENRMTVASKEDFDIVNITKRFTALATNEH